MNKKQFFKRNYLEDKLSIKNFKMVSLLGEGSSAEVFLVRHIASNKLFAMKKI